MKTSIKTLMKHSTLKQVFIYALDLLNAALRVYSAYLSGLELEYLMSKDYKNALMTAILIGCMLLVVYFINYVSELSKNHVRKNCMMLYRKLVLNDIRNSEKGIDHNFYISSLVNDATKIDEVISCRFNQMKSIIIVIGSGIGIGYYNVWLVPICMILYVCNLFVNKILSDKSAINEERRSKSMETYLSNTSNMIHGYKVFDIHNAKNRMVHLLSQQNKALEETKKEVKNQSSMFEMTTQNANVLSQSILVVVILYGIYTHRISYAAYFAMVDLVVYFFNNISSFAMNTIEIKGVSVVVDRIIQNLPDVDTTIQEVKDYDVTLENVSFAYGDHMVIDDFSYEFKYGKKYLVIGPSGCGKSTLLKLIDSKIEPISGTVRLGNMNYKELNPYTIHKYIGYVVQDPYIFSGTLKDNVTLFEETNKGVKEALELSKVNEFMKDQDTIIEKNGSNLSGGQKQRIAIARELYAKRKVVLFDEVTSSVDHKLNKEMIQSLTGINDTVIFVAHHYDESIKDLFDEVVDLSHA